MSASALARAHADQACRAFEWLSREVERGARNAGTLAFHAPRYDELAEWAHALDALDAVPERIRQRLAAWREAHEAGLRHRETLETYAERVEALRTHPRPDRPEWRHEALALAEIGRAVLDDAPDWRAHLEAAPDLRHRVAAALTTLCRQLAAAGVLDAAEAAHPVPCRDRVLVGDRVCATVHGPRRTSYERGPKIRIEGTVQSVTALGEPADDLVLVRLAAASDASVPAGGAPEWYPMRDLLEYACRRAPWTDEAERARLAARDAREAAERQAFAARVQAQERTRERHHAHRRDRGWSW